MTRRAIWLPLGLFAVVALGLVSLFGTEGQASAQAAATADVSVGSVTIDQNGVGRVDITVTPTAGVIGALDLSVDYDAALVTPATPGPASAGPAIVGAAEAGANCSNSTDDDGDTVVNDGCPAVAETVDQCYDGADNDTLAPDGVVDDGCQPCSSAFGVCNPALDPIPFSLANLATGISGTAGTIFFQAGAALGTSPLVLAVITCGDDQGANATCTPTDGSTTVQVPPTASPTPVPTATPVPTPVGQTPSPTPVGQTFAPTATPAVLPPSGGGSSSSALPLLLAAIGLAALTSGAWAVTRLRGVRA